MSALPFFVRVRKKIAEYDTFVSKSMQEWEGLLAKSESEKGLNAGETERLLELDDILEALHGKHVAVEGTFEEECIEVVRSDY